MAVERYWGNPVLSAADVPYRSSLVFNAGVCKYQGRYVMMFRNDYGFSPTGWSPEDTGTDLGLAFSDDGVRWRAEPEPWRPPERWMADNPEIRRFYDPRLTVIDGRCYICFAVDTRHGLRGGMAVTSDFEDFEVLSLTAPDNRNLVLFPEKIGGEFVRLERPFPVYSRNGGENFDIWLSRSPDCRYWGRTELVLGLERVPFGNSKIGPAAPPIRTPKGWLALFHATVLDPGRPLAGWETANSPAAVWCKEYRAGVMLLDSDDPSRIIGLATEPVLTAETAYELDGFRGSVIFPGGLIAEEDGSVKIYYGAADTVECLAATSVDELLAMIRPL